MVENTRSTSSAHRRRRRGPLVLIVVLVILAGLVIGGDQVARVVGQRELAGILQSQLRTPTAPSVQIRGFPFLLQLARSHFGEVHATASDVQLDVEGKQFTVSSLDATAYDVVGSNGYQQVSAGRGELQAVLSYAGVSTLTGLQVTSAGDGKIATNFDITIGGTQITGTASGRPVLDVDKQQLSFADVSVRIGNAADVTLADAAGQIVLAPIPVDQVPYGLRVTGIEVRDDGVALSATGTNIPLRQ